ncbi:unnamed protein product [Pleuronectes platessa]|uniref:Uncharacterized protein n=1 Tax=Pleuronectes platessa TaxID=8262 RepID=A0A9N7YTZ9_PLEPL|nr:unnamed protein product [Pleuronectes platessa]
MIKCRFYYRLITAEVCDIISDARRFGVATVSSVTSQAPARQGLAFTPRFGVASASGVNPAGQENDYAKQGSDPSMCHQLVPQVPSEGQAQHTPSLLPNSPPLALLWPTDQ